MATMRRFEPLLKNDIHPLGKEGWGFPMGPVGKGGGPRGLGRACVACACIRLQSSLSDWDRESRRVNKKEGGLRNEDAGG